MKRLWGDQFYNGKERKWNKTGGDGYVRGFCQFVLDPIFKVSCHLLWWPATPTTVSSSLSLFIPLTGFRCHHEFQEGRDKEADREAGH